MKGQAAFTFGSVASDSIKSAHAVELQKKLKSIADHQDTVNGVKRQKTDSPQAMTPVGRQVLTASTPPSGVTLIGKLPLVKLMSNDVDLKCLFLCVLWLAFLALLCDGLGLFLSIQLAFSS